MLSTKFHFEKFIIKKVTRGRKQWGKLRICLNFGLRIQIICSRTYDPLPIFLLYQKLMFNNLKIFAVTTICQVFAKRKNLLLKKRRGSFFDERVNRVAIWPF